MTILALDPSSTAIGYCVFVGPSHRDMGVLKPIKRAETSDDRIDSLAWEVADLLKDYKPDQVVIEIPAYARPGRNVKIACLLWQVYGEVRRTCVAAGVRVEGVYVSTWKRNAAKASTVATTAMLVKGYSAELDKGGDASDAFGLGTWWLARKGTR